VKIAERLAKLAEDGMITAQAVEKAKEKGWITAKQKTDMDKKVDDVLVTQLENTAKLAEARGIISKGVADSLKGLKRNKG
jgi:hypothetical protein